MATVDRPLSQPQPRVGGTPDTAHPVVKPPRPVFLRSWFAFVVVLGLVVAHVIGWQVAQVQPELLVTKAPDMARFFSDLLRPDVIAQDQKQLQVSLPIVGVDTPPAQVTEGKVENTIQPVIKRAGETEELNVDTSQLESFNVSITTSTDKITPGGKITVKGTGLRPNSDGAILWQSTGTNASTQTLGTYKTDAQGNFTVDVTVPAEADRVVNSFGFPNTLAVSQTWGFGNIYPSDTLGLVLQKVVETIFLALMGTTFAIIISIPISFLASRNLMPRTLIGNLTYTIARTILNVLRSIEALILAIIFAATLGLGPFAGVMALTLHSIASLGKLYSEAIESIDPGPLEAITATGANRLQMIVYAVIPQFIPQFLSFTIYRWDINVRMSTIIGFVGGGGIGFILKQYIDLLQFNKAATCIWAIAIVVMAMDWASAKLRAKVI
jgi:phosphonate transport system permease protein